jgi:hypothetical protein
MERVLDDAPAAATAEERDELDELDELELELELELEEAPPLYWPSAVVSVAFFLRLTSLAQCALSIT